MEKRLEDSDTQVGRSRFDKTLIALAKGFGALMLSACSISHSPEPKIAKGDSEMIHVDPSPVNTFARVPASTSTSPSVHSNKARTQEDIIKDNANCHLVCTQVGKPLGQNDCTMEEPDVAAYIQEQLKKNICPGPASIKMKFE